MKKFVTPVDLKPFGGVRWGKEKVRGPYFKKTSEERLQAEL